MFRKNGRTYSYFLRFCAILKANKRGSNKSMKLRTRLVISFIIVISIPVILSSALTWGLAQYQLRKLVQMYGVTGTEYLHFSDSLQTLMNMAEVRDFLTNAVVGIFIVILFTAFVLIIWIYSGIIIPIRNLQIAVNNVAEGNLDFEIVADSKDEIGKLVESFDEMRKRLKENEDMKIQSDRENRELISNISHDLKTPITTVKGYSEGILDGMADSPEKLDRYVRTIYNKANDMEKLINELTLYSKINTNRIPYNYTTLSVTDYFMDCAEELEMELSSKGVAFHFDNSVEAGQRIIADPEQLRRVINNIVSNSLKYGRKANALIALRVKDVGDFIQVELEDNGQGIAAKDLPHIFDRFYRADASRNSTTGGSGIGLSIVQKIIEDHGGKIWVTSKEGVGTTMYFVIRKYQEVPIYE